MVRSSLLAVLLPVSFLLTISLLSAIAIADDTSGNISVQVTKLDESVTYLLLIAAGFLIVIAIAAVSTLLYLRRVWNKNRTELIRKEGQSKKAHKPRADTRIYRPDERQPIRVPDTERASRKHADYYTEVFTAPASPVTLTDEKSGKPAITPSRQELPDGGLADVDRYLKEDERIVLNVLRMKHNSCTQATLRVVTDFSKAKLSRLLSELEERGVIYKEQQGRKNLVTLRT